MSRTRLIVTTLFVVILGLIAAPAIWAGSLTPSTPASISASGNGNAVLLVDVDGDGVLDLVVLEGAPTKKLEVFLGDGKGSFTTPAAVSMSVGTNPVAVAAGTLTGGTLPDLAIADAGAGNLIVLQNTTAAPGSPSFSALGPYALPGSTPSPQAVAIADMNADGSLDVVVADPGDTGVTIMLGNGVAALTLTATTSSPYALGNIADSQPFAIVADKFDGTGVVGIAVANRGSANVTVYTNTASTATDVTLTAADFAVGTSPVAIVSGTIKNSAPTADLAVANSGSGNITALINNGSGSFTATNFPTTGNPFAIGLADFNADTKNDVVVAASDGKAYLLFGDGAGSFGTPTGYVLNIVAFNPSALAVGDIGRAPGGTIGSTADGRMDVVVADSGSTSVYEQLSSPFSNIQTFAATIQEGVAFPATTEVLTFEYDGSPAVGQFTAAVNDYGDGNSGAATVTLPASPTYNVQTGHTYSDPLAEGPHSILIQLTNTTDNQTLVGTSNQTVGDAPLSAGAAIAIADIAPGGTYTGPVANFIDANTTAPITDFDFTVAGSVNWGDATPTSPGDGNPVTVTQPGGLNTPFQAAGTHIYNTVGTFTITTHVVDTDSGNGFGGNTVDVTNTINVTSITPTGGSVTATEGTALANGTTIATFNGVAGHSFTAQVLNWGDGQGPDSNVTVVGGGPAYQVQTSSSTHAYATNIPAPGPATIFVTDTTDTSTSTFTVPVTVNDATLSALVVTAPTGANCLPAPCGTGPGGKLLANVDTWNGDIATFHDANPLATVSQFSGTIAWGDGASTPFTSANLTDNGGGNFTITASHQFTKAGSALSNVQVTVNDVGGSSIGPVASATPAVVGNLSNPVAVNVNATEGASFTGIVGRFDNSIGADVVNATINWNDPNCTPQPACSSSAGVIALVSGSTYSVTGTHTYPLDGSPAITVAVADATSGDNLNIAGGTNVVAEAALSTPNPLITFGPVQEGTALTNVTVLVFDDANPLAGQCPTQAPPALPCEYTATINWDDGSSSAGTVTGNIGGPYTVTGSHTYAEGGLDPQGSCVGGNPNATCAIKVTINDGINPTTITAHHSADALVFDAALTPTAAGPLPPVIEGNPVNGGVPVVVATFTDGNTTTSTAADFTAAIHWGDGASTAGTVTGPVGGPYTITGTYTYPEGGLDATTDGVHPGASCTQAQPSLCTITVDVTDAGGATITAFVTANIQVADGNLTANAPQTFSPPTSQFSGTLGGFTDQNPIAPAGDFTASINWGDGFITAGSVTGAGGAYTVNGSHLYLTNGGSTVTVTITVHDAGGKNTTVTAFINVPNVNQADFNAGTSVGGVLLRPGQHNDLVLTLSPNPNVPGGFPSPVNFSGCDVVPAEPTITCTFNPDSVPDVTMVRQLGMTIHTTGVFASAGAPPRIGHQPLTQLALLLPGFVGVILLGGSRKNRNRTMLWWGSIFLLMSLVLVGCGGSISGGGGIGTPNGQYRVVPHVSNPDASTPQACSPGQTVGCLPFITVTVQ